MASGPVELHMAKNIHELESMAEVSGDTVKKKDVRELIDYLDKLYAASTKALQDGNEERAYVLATMYIRVLLQMQKKPEYAKERKFWEAMIGPNKPNTILSSMETLKESLKKRYVALNKAIIPKEIPKKQENNFISSEELHRMWEDHKISLLIMDCRPRMEYADTHIKWNCCFNVPAEIIKPGMSAGKIQSDLSPDGKVMWASRSVKDHVILVDWKSRKGELGETLRTLRIILTDWDPDVQYRNPLLILNEGYTNFMNTYPMYVFNPSFGPIQITTEKDIVIDDIEYPDMSDIKMKDDVPTSLSPGTLSSTRIPIVDRSSKAAALAKNTQYVQEKKIQFDKTIQQIKEIEQQYDETEQMENAIPESDTEATNELLSQKLHLSNKIIELDDISENILKEAQQSLEEHRAVILDDVEDDASLAGQRIDDSTAAAMEMQANMVDRMNQARARFDRERKPVAYQQRKFEADREKSRRLELINNNNVPAKPVLPAQPTFDRSIKPALGVYEDLPEYRSFNAEPGGEGHGLTGLKNLGNTCYMNSIMQCLSNTPPLKDYFISEEGYRKQFHRSSKTQRQIAEEVSAVMREIWLNKHRHIASNDLRRVIGQCKQIFRGMDQQDSHEFLTILMDWLHLDLQPYNQMSIPNGKQTASEKAWMDFVKCKESYIMKLFYGQIKSTVKCRQCERESATYEGFSNLSLELPSNSNRCTIADCLNLYFYGERISGWNCPKCQAPRDAIKKLDITKLPPILVIHFKRFNVDLDSSVTRYTKKQNFVDFPLTDFNVSEYIAPLERKSHQLHNSEYRLYGVSNHYGTMERGHYTAFCKSSHYGKWFKYDDHVVSPMDSSDVRSSAAYILFYTSIDLQRR